MTITAEADSVDTFDCVESTESTNTLESSVVTEEIAVMKLTGFDFYRTALKSAKYVVAPMVRGKEKSAQGANLIFLG